MTKINLPSYEQQQQILADIKNVKTSVESGGFNPLSYNPITKKISLAVSTTSRELLNIEGEGFFTNIFISNTNTSSVGVMLEIIVDGETIFLSPHSSISQNDAKGVVRLSNINDTTKSAFNLPVYSRNTVESLPFIESTGNASVLLTDLPIKFEKSLVIKANNNATFVTMMFTGGIKK